MAFGSVLIFHWHVLKNVVVTAKQTVDIIFYSTWQITRNSVQGYRSFVFVNKNQKRHNSQMMFCNEIVGVSRVIRDRLYNKSRHGHIDIKDHDDVIKWKHFPRNWPFVREIHRSPVNFPHKGQWRGALMFSLIYAWINDWVNNREAGDLRRQHGHYDVIVMRNWLFMYFHMCCSLR